METKDRIIFKLEPEQNQTVIAFIIDAPVNFGNIGSYQHIGQHSEASIDYFHKCKPAAPAQYEGVKKEMESLGYNISIRHRLPVDFRKIWEWQYA